MSLPEELREEERVLTEFETARIIEILRKRDGSVARVIAGLDLAVDSEDAVDAILALIEREMGEEFPAAARAELEELAREAWSTGARYKLRANDGRLQAPLQVIEHFATAMQLDLGVTYKGAKNAKRFRAAVESVLGGANRRAVLKDLQQAVLGELQDPEELRKVDWMLRQESNRARNYARTKRFVELGITELEVLAVLDTRTSAICRLMHGRRVDVRQAAAFVDDWLATDPADLRERFPQPPNAVIRSFDGQATTEIMKGLSVSLPPYHAGGCRSTVVEASRTEVRTLSGRSLDGEPKLPAGLKDGGRLAERFADIRNLTPQERLAKARSLGTAQWNPERLARWAESQRDVFQLDADAYAEQARAGVREFSRLFVAYGEDNRRLYAFYNETQNAMTVVDYDDFEIRGMFRPASEDLEALIEIL